MKAKRLFKKGQLDAAAALFKAVLDAYPQNGQAARGLAAIEQMLSPTATVDIQTLERELKHLVRVFNSGDFPQALDVGQRLKVQYPGQPLIHNVLGAVYAHQRDYESAVASYTTALKIQPDYAEAHCNLGAAYNDMGRQEDAIASYTAALELKPDYAEAAGKRLFLLAQFCEWDMPQLNSVPVADIGLSLEKVFPFDLLSIDDNPSHHRQRAELYARNTFQSHASSSIKRPDAVPARLRIGYFSADFHNHPVMYLMAKLFELHDRKQFEIFAYSYGRGRSDDMRDRITQAVDGFYDVSHSTDSEIAELCRAHKIDIAVDLNGYTRNTRLEIFSHRIAPVQISFLGYPGTTGAPFIDYLVADERVIPREYSHHYSESIIYMPHSYQVNDNSRTISDSVLARAEAGLPEDAFVFCCFNNNYKIGPTEFDIWMRLLQRVEGSVLWLFRSNARAEENLRKQAQNRGVESERLVFADRLPHAEHLARHRLADVFLDTFTFNAHTTASDALWAGLPVVTKVGEGFAARVAGSLLHAIGLDELATSSENEYEQLALELARDAGRLAAVKKKLEENRASSPLFDTALFARDMEDAYQRAYQNYFDAQAPCSISIQS